MRIEGSFKPLDTLMSRSKSPAASLRLASFFIPKVAMGIPKNFWKESTSTAKAPSSGRPASAAAA